MNLNRALIAGVAGGVVTFFADFFQHGILMAKTYEKYPLFTKTEANPLWFLAISVLIGIFAAILFAKTRSSWADGVKGGMTFGLYLGMVFFFQPFYSSLVLEGFPYHLSWCWGGIGLIDALLFGAVAGAIYKSA